MLNDGHFRFELFELPHSLPLSPSFLLCFPFFWNRKKNSTGSPSANPSRQVVVYVHAHIFPKNRTLSLATPPSLYLNPFTLVHTFYTVICNSSVFLFF